MDENHYYPFGLKHQKYTNPGGLELKAVNESTARPGYATTTPFMYRYNGSEYQDELGLNMYDMDMRQYDPAIARWVVLDPVIHHSMSPYNAFDNNPVFWADPSGADSVFDNLGTSVASLTNISSGFSIGAGGASSKSDSSESSSQNNDKTKIGSISASWTPEDEAQFPGDDSMPGAIPLTPKVINDMSQLDGAVQDGVNEAFGIWSNWGTGNSFDLSYTMRKLNQVATATEGIAIFYGKYGRYADSKALKVTGKAAGKLAPIVSAAAETNDYLNGDISGMRYGFRMSGIAASTLVGAEVGTAMGGPWGFVAGAATGAAFGTAEYGYDKAEEVIAPKMNIHINHFYNQVINSFSNGFRR